MISICIPIYNYYAYPLVRRLTTQIEQLKAEDDFEVICIDNHSSGYYLNQNNGICDIANYMRLSENIGRARVRNLFLKYAKGEWLLFLNDDSQLPNHFLRNYRRCAGGREDVVVGGREYDKHNDDPQHHLRYLWASDRESKPAEERRKNPYRSFMSCNFMIRRSVFESITFDTRVQKYGYSDALFAYRLEERKVPVAHIDNPVVAGYLETNLEFLNKTIESVESLVAIYDFMWEDQRFCHTVPLLRRYGKMRRMGMTGLIYRIYKTFKNPLQSHFVSGTAITLKQFSFYQLGYFIGKMHYNAESESLG